MMTGYGYCNPMADYGMSNDIQEYIHDEMKDSRYYALLAQKAPTRRAQELLLVFSQDEWAHAQNLMQAYVMLTESNPMPGPVEEPVIPEYREALKDRIMAETADYKKYGDKYLAACNPWLKNLFFTLRTIEAQHAMRMPLLLAEGA